MATRGRYWVANAEEPDLDHNPISDKSALQVIITYSITIDLRSTVQFAIIPEFSSTLAFTTTQLTCKLSAHEPMSVSDLTQLAR